MGTKIAAIRDMAEQGDWHEAIRLAGTFPRLGEHRVSICRAKEAVCRPDFQRQLGRDPDQLIVDGIAAMRDKWDL